MSLKVFWTKEAEETFNRNISYLEQEWGESVIESFILKTEQSISAIQKHPQLYPAINKKKGIHKCLIVKQVSLYYESEKTELTFLPSGTIIKTLRN